MKAFFFSSRKARMDHRRRASRGRKESAVSVVNKVLMENPEDSFQKIIERLKTANSN